MLSVVLNLCFITCVHLSLSFYRCPWSWTLVYNCRSILLSFAFPLPCYEAVIKASQWVSTVIKEDELCFQTYYTLHFCIRGIRSKSRTQDKNKIRSCFKDLIKNIGLTLETGSHKRVRLKPGSCRFLLLLCDWDEILKSNPGSEKLLCKFKTWLCFSKNMNLSV